MRKKRKNPLTNCITYVTFLFMGKGKPIAFNQTRCSIHMEHGVKDRGLRLAQYHAEKLMDRYGTASLSSFIKMTIVDEYRKMKAETKRFEKLQLQNLSKAGK